MKIAIFDINYFTKDEIEYLMKCEEKELETIINNDENQTCCSYTLQEYADIVNENNNIFNECKIRIYNT